MIHDAKSLIKLLLWLCRLENSELINGEKYRMSKKLQDKFVYLENAETRKNI